MLYLLSGEDLIFHDCAVKLALVSTQQLHNTQGLENQPFRLGKWDPDPQLLLPCYLLVLAERWVRVFYFPKAQIQSDTTKNLFLLKENDYGHKVGSGWNSWREDYTRQAFSKQACRADLRCNVGCAVVLIKAE